MIFYFLSYVFERDFIMALKRDSQIGRERERGRERIENQDESILFDQQTRQEQISIEILSSFDLSQVHTGLGLRIDMVGGKTTLGCWFEGIRERYVERDRFCDELFVRRHGSPQGRSLLQGTKGK